MKTLITFITATIIIAGCSSKSEFEKKKAALKEAKSELVEVKKKVFDLEAELAKLDTTKEESGKPVEVTKIQHEAFAHFVKVHGVVEASKNILINPEVSGKITQILVKEGERVSQGQKIVVIDPSVIQNNIAELKKRNELATTVFERQKALYEQKIGSEISFLEAKTNKEALDKSLNSLYSQLDKFVIKAPISGYIDEILPKVGELASPQMPVVRIVNLDKVFIESEVSEALLGKINEGDKVEVAFNSLGRTVAGKIIQIGQFIDPNNRTFKVKVDLLEQDKMFKPNLLAVVKYRDYTASNTVVVSSKVIQDDLKGTFVFVKKGKQSAKQYIKKGITYDGKTEIKEGLDSLDVLISNGYRGLLEGDRVYSVSNSQ